MEIVTANELLSGAVVYYGVDGTWQTEIGRARYFTEGETDARDAVVAVAGASGRLVGVEIETIRLVAGRPVPTRLRARIRAGGPTAPYGPERQDPGDDNVSL